MKTGGQKISLELSAKSKNGVTLDQIKKMVC